MRILVLVNTLTSVQSEAYASHIALFTHTVRTRPDIELLLFTPNRFSIDNARNQAAIFALENECTHVLMLDDDVLVPPNAIIQLVEDDKDIVAGLTYIRGYPFKPMVFREVETGKVEHWEPPKGELSECWAVGFSLCLIKCDVIQAMMPPYFVTGPAQTEDVYFCAKARDTLVPVPEVWVDARVKTGHLCNALPVTPDNVEFFREFYGKLYGKQRDSVPQDRGIEYMRENFADEN